MKLSAIFSSGMVLQRNQAIRIRGQSNQSEISLTFLGNTYKSKANKKGEFTFQLPPHQEGGPYTMTLNDGTDYILDDVYIGDVWLLGGQSNMQLPLRRILDEEPIESFQITQPQIRQFTLDQQYDFHQPQSTLIAGSWISVNPNQILNFSAAGYYFAKELYEDLHIPIGLILTAIGGSPVEAWISEETLHTFKRYDEEICRLKSDSYITKIMEEESSLMSSWYNKLFHADLGLQNLWYHETFNDRSWETIQVPGLWHGTELETLRGSIWLRSTFYLSSLPSVEKSMLKLGTIIDADDVYINGTLVGHTDYQYPPRRYQVPCNLLHVGINSIAVRIISTANVGGFVPEMPYYLEIDEEKIDLCGSWRYKIGAMLPPLPSQTFFQYKPTGLYNGMLAPLKEIKLTGFAFYQGESNTSAPYEYQALFEAMVKDWRRLFDQGDLPFLYVQLPNFGEHRHQNNQTNWAVLREQQRRAKRLPNVAMITAIDIGAFNDLHPQKKKELGIRLSLAARKFAYHEDIISCGPTITNASLITLADGYCLELGFDNLGQGIQPTDHPLKHFSVTFQDGTVMELPAYHKGKLLRIPLPDDQIPVKVAYAFSNNPENINFYNSLGLPAEAFEIDITAVKNPE